MKLSRLTFILIGILGISSSCNTSKDWNEINSVIINQNNSISFEESNFEDLLCDSLSVQLDPVVFKRELINSKSEGTNYVIKGGYWDAIILFNDSTELKIGLSTNYGVIKIVESNESFLTSDNSLRPNRWFEMKK